MKYFPILLFCITILSCNDKIKNTNYNTFYSKGIEFENNNQIDSAYYYYNKAKLSCSEKEVNRKVYAIFLISKLQENQGDYNGSEETATESFKYIKDCDSLSYVHALYNCLGINYEEKKDYENALLYYHKILATTKKPIDKIIVKNNIAVTYLEQKKYSKAIETLKPLLTNDTLIKNKSEYARVSDNLGFAYFNLKQDSLAKKLLENSLKIRDSINDDYEKIASYMHLSQFHENKNPLLAKEMAQKAYQFAFLVNSPDDKLEALQLLIKNPTNTNAIHEFETYSFLNDSIHTARQIAKNQFAKIKYDSRFAFEKSEKLKTQNRFIILAFIGFVLIVVLSYFLFASRNKRKLQKTAYQTEIRISKQLHDELANDVYNTMTFAETQDLSNPNKKEKFLNQIETIYNRTRNISLENSDIDTGDNFKKNLAELISSYSNDTTHVILKNFDDLNWSKTKSITKITIYRIIQELLVNMKKHSQSTIVVIGFETKKKTSEINYSDNGIGTAKMLKLKNGLKNMEYRIKNINGIITFESEFQKGFRVKIVFPK